MRIINKILTFIIAFICIVSCGVINTSVFAYDSSILNQEIPSGYYDDLDCNLTGEAFKNALYDIISVGHVKTPYGGQTNSVLQKSDPDPNKSGYIICLYTGQSLSSGWNKEHVWAKSHGFPNSSTEPYCDLHHLRPTLVSINSSRGNSDFGELDGVSCSSDSYGNKWTSTIFEPRDEVKGDVARMMFYMETRYGSKTSFNLKLVNQTTTSTSDGNGKFGHLDTLLKWHYEDPVSDSEIYRNNVVYGYQKNRNPYIDHPEYVDLAYPNGFSDSSINQEEIDNVIAKINTLPSVITLLDEDLIDECYSLYNVLNIEEKKLVTNYSILANAKSKLDELKEEQNKPVLPEGEKLTIDFTTTTGITGSYQANQKGVVAGKTYNFSYAYKSGTDVRLGHNKNASVPSKFNISGDGSALEFSYDIENIKSISFGKNGSYGSISKWYIMLSTDGGNTYKELGNGTDIENIFVNLDSPVSGRIALVIVGSKPRLVLGTATIILGTDEQTYNITYNNMGIGTNPNKVSNVSKIESLPSISASGYTFEGWYYDANFTKEAKVNDVLTSDVTLYAKWNLIDTNIDVSVGTYLSVDYTYAKGTYTVTKYTLNFTPDLKDFELNSNDEYYMVLIKTENLYSSIKDSFEHQSIDDFVKDYQGYLYEIDTNNNVVKISSRIDEEYTAVFVAYSNGTYYFSNETTYSVKTVIEYYLDNNVLTDQIMIDVLSTLI